MDGKYWDMGITLVSSCTRVSPACDHCWALSLERFYKKDNSEVVFHEDRLKRITSRKKPTIFSIWNDLFHEKVTDEQILKAWEVFKNSNPKHKILVLTKRIWRASMMNLPIIKNVYIGTTIEEIGYFISRMKHISLLKRQGHKTFISFEPLLGSIGFDDEARDIDWIICGRETGQKAREMKEEWALKLLSIAKKYDIPFYYKKGPNGRILIGQEWNEVPW